MWLHHPCRIILQVWFNRCGSRYRQRMCMLKVMRHCNFGSIRLAQEIATLPVPYSIVTLTQLVCLKRSLGYPCRILFGPYHDMPRPMRGLSSRQTGVDLQTACPALMAGILALDRMAQRQLCYLKQLDLAYRHRQGYGIQDPLEPP